MGMFDELTCKYPLPVVGLEGRVFQTKDTPSQSLDHYEIREDGSLWGAEYDIEDRSDPNATGLDSLIGCMTRVNERPVRQDLTGEIRFYDFHKNFKGWVEFSAYFVNGMLKDLHTVECREAEQEPTK